MTDESQPDVRRTRIYLPILLGDNEENTHCILLLILLYLPVSTDESPYSLHTAKVFSTVLVRKCGSFQIPRATKILSARVQIMQNALSLWADTSYLAECGVSVVCLGLGLPQPSYG